MSSNSTSQVINADIFESYSGASLSDALQTCCNNVGIDSWYQAAPPGAKMFICMVFYAVVHHHEIVLAEYESQMRQVEPELTIDDWSYLLRDESDVVLSGRYQARINQLRTGKVGEFGSFHVDCEFYAHLIEKARKMRKTVFGRNGEIPDRPVELETASSELDLTPVTEIDLIGTEPEEETDGTQSARRRCLPMAYLLLGGVIVAAVLVGGIMSAPYLVAAFTERKPTETQANERIVESEVAEDSAPSPIEVPSSSRSSSSRSSVIKSPVEDGVVGKRKPIALSDLVTNDVDPIPIAERQMQETASVPPEKIEDVISSRFYGKVAARLIRGWRPLFRADAALPMYIMQPSRNGESALYVLESDASEGGCRLRKAGSCDKVFGSIEEFTRSLDDTGAFVSSGESETVDVMAPKDGHWQRKLDEIGTTPVSSVVMEDLVNLATENKIDISQVSFEINARFGDDYPGRCEVFGLCVTSRFPRAWLLAKVQTSCQINAMAYGLRGRRKAGVTYTGDEAKIQAATDEAVSKAKANASAEIIVRHGADTIEMGPDEALGKRYTQLAVVLRSPNSNGARYVNRDRSRFLPVRNMNRNVEVRRHDVGFGRIRERNYEPTSEQKSEERQLTSEELAKIEEEHEKEMIDFKRRINKGTAPQK